MKVDDRIMNLDHICGNLPDMDPLAFLEHTKLFLSMKGGYPCVSYLPDRFEDPAVAEQFASLIHAWEK